jgi:hypothetical protein
MARHGSQAAIAGTTSSVAVTVAEFQSVYLARIALGAPLKTDITTWVSGLPFLISRLKLRRGRGRHGSLWPNSDHSRGALSGRHQGAYRTSFKRVREAAGLRSNATRKARNSVLPDRIEATTIQPDHLPNRLCMLGRQLVSDDEGEMQMVVVVHDSTHERQPALDASEMPFAPRGDKDVNLAGITLVLADVTMLTLDDHLLAFAVISCALL